MPDFSLTGVPELERQFTELSQTGMRRVALAGVKAGLQVSRGAIQAAAPVADGDLKRTIGLRMARAREINLFLGKTGPDVGRRPRRKVKGIKSGSLRLKGEGDGQGGAPHAHLVTLGTAERFRGIKYLYMRARGRRAQHIGQERTGNAIVSTGRITPNAFIRTAAASSQARAKAAMMDRIREVLPREAAKLK
jgi:hypothetical protein